MARTLNKNAKATATQAAKAGSKATTEAKGTGRQRRTASTVKNTGTKEVEHVTHNVASVLASIPDPALATAYVHRKIAGKVDFDFLDLARANRMNVLIEGPTGPGKTMFTRAWAAERRLVMARVPSNIGLDPSQLFGRHVPTADGGFRWVDGPVTHVVRHGGVLLINEVNFVPERVATVLFGLLDANREIVLLDHEGEIIKAHDDLVIVADMNPDYEGTRPLNKAFRNRFDLQLVWDYDAAVEAKLVTSKSLLAMAGQIRTEAAKGTYDTPVSTNMLMEFERLVSLVNIEFAILNFVNHFAYDERAAVQVVAQTFKGNLVADYRKPDKASNSKANDKTDVSFEDAELERRLAMKDGEVDPEWGIKGEDWVWEDEAD